MINFDELFKNHKTTRTDCGPLSIITYKKPDSFENGLRYIFDNELSTLSITEDWLKAIAVNVNNMGSPDRLYEFVCRNHSKYIGKCLYGDYELDFDIGYLNSKIVTNGQSNSYENLDYYEIEQHVKSVLQLDEFELDDRDDEETHAIHTITQSILDMIDEDEILCEENFEHYLTDEEQFEIEDLLEKYDVSLEQILRIAPPVNDALVVVFEGFKRAYKELTSEENQMNILDYVKELVEEIYNRKPNWDYPIQVYPDKIVIKDTGRFPCDYIIETMDEFFLVTADYGNPSVYSPCETIGQVIDFILE